MRKTEIIQNHCISILLNVYRHELENGYGKLTYQAISDMSGVPHQTCVDLIREACYEGEHSRLACIATKYDFIFKADPTGRCKLSVVKAVKAER